ncbi:hypothetical protein VNO78_00679 [Psophocarpus tetragonolobus]|uniref:Uncharacterized protein n=1 Tax=Psophocarpus tetragonolobus TaxID=3891 RepID=A0AAN9SYC8_PSOTE
MMIMSVPFNQNHKIIQKRNKQSWLVSSVVDIMVKALRDTGGKIILKLLMFDRCYYFPFSVKLKAKDGATYPHISSVVDGERLEKEEMPFSQCF